MQNGSRLRFNLKNAVIGNARDISDKSVFHKISLIAFFAWVGLGSDPLSSSCYGPEEIMRNLQGHANLSIFVGILTVITIFIISTSIFTHLPEAKTVADRSLSEMSGTVSQLGIFGTIILMLKAYSMGAGTYTGIGLVMTSSILITVKVLKFGEGGWITIVITGLLATSAFLIKRHYDIVRKKLILIQKEVMHMIPDIIKNLNRKHKNGAGHKPHDVPGRTAVIMVNGYNGLGLFSLFRIIDSFNSECQHIVFLQVGLVDSKSIRGKEQIDKLTENMVVDSIFIGGQLIFGGNAIFSRLLHNYTIFAIQRKLYRHGMTTIVIPIPLEIDRFNSNRNLNSLIH